MSNEITNFLTPVGRLVQGDVFTGKNTDQQGQPLVYKTGAMAGQPRTDYFFALAIAKNDPGLAEFMKVITDQAGQDFPHLKGASGTIDFPGFSWKFKDGDDTTPDVNGRRNCDREGFPGHYVFSFSGSNAPGVHKRDQSGNIIPIVNPEELKKGYYIQVFGSVKGNGQQQKPGIYLNHSMVLLCGYGEEIVSGPDANAVFGNAPVAPLPQGASATPLAAMPVNAAPQPPAMPQTTMPAPQATIPQAQQPAPAPAVPQVPPTQAPYSAAPPAGGPSAAPNASTAMPPFNVPGVPGVPGVTQ